MEAGTHGHRGGLSRSLLLIIGLVLLIRLPFLNQAIQGDDPYYIFGAEHALIDPAHPLHARYIFQGETVDMRGHPHGPLNSWILAALIAVFGDVYEAPFHAVYIVFSMIAAVSMWSLARRWSPDDPLWPTLLFLVTPAFLINGNSLESDFPPFAFWMAGMALFTTGRFAWGAAALAIAALGAYQTIAATPILFLYCWWHARRSKSAWALALTPVIVVAAFQLYERLTGGALPATVLAGYFSSYGLQQLANKLRNAAALTVHTGWLVFPLITLIAFRRLWPLAAAAALAGIFIDANPLFWGSFAAGATVIAWCCRKVDFLKAWVLVFFAAALALFFAGSARYLLPMAAPVAILVARQRKLLPVAFAANLVIGLALAFVNFQHWGGYRQFARSLRHEIQTKRVWVNGEWGLRFYTESEGALPLARKHVLQPGDWVVSSELGYPIPITAPLALVAERDIRPTLPLRLIGLGSKSGYSAASFGLRPFDIAFGPADRVRAELVLERKPQLSSLPMDSPEAAKQMVSGIYELEGKTRWMSGRGVLLLKPPPESAPLQVQIYLPDRAPARTVTVLVDGIEAARETLSGPGVHTITTAPVQGSTITITLDKTFTVPGDFRELGAVLMAVGYK